jgi:hypothetical protein
LCGSLHPIFPVPGHPGKGEYTRKCPFGKIEPFDFENQQAEFKTVENGKKSVFRGVLGQKWPQNSPKSMILTIWGLSGDLGGMGPGNGLAGRCRAGLP